MSSKESVEVVKLILRERVRQRTDVPIVRLPLPLTHTSFLLRLDLCLIFVLVGWNLDGYKIQMLGTNVVQTNLATC